MTLKMRVCAAPPNEALTSNLSELHEDSFLSKPPFYTNSTPKRRIYYTNRAISLYHISLFNSTNVIVRSEVR